MEVETINTQTFRKPINRILQSMGLPLRAVDHSLENIRVVGKKVGIEIVAVTPEEFGAEYEEASGIWRGSKKVKEVGGFAQRHPYGDYLVVKLESFEQTLDTLGHEIGHLLTPKLERKIDEEGKAMIFEYEWDYVIDRDKIIPNSNIPLQYFYSHRNNREPYKSAYFVLNNLVIKMGLEPLDIYRMLSKGEINLLEQK
jgi:hypothetical protein